MRHRRSRLSCPYGTTLFVSFVFFVENILRGQSILFRVLQLFGLIVRHSLGEADST